MYDQVVTIFILTKLPLKKKTIAITACSQIKELALPHTQICKSTTADKFTQQRAINVKEHNFQTKIEAQNHNNST